MNNLSRELFLTGLGEDPIYLASVSPMLEAISKMMSFKSTLYSLKANFDKKCLYFFARFCNTGVVRRIEPENILYILFEQRKKNRTKGKMLLQQEQFFVTACKCPPSSANTGIGVFVMIKQGRFDLTIMGSGCSPQTC